MHQETHPCHQEKERQESLVVNITQLPSAHFLCMYACMAGLHINRVYRCKVRCRSMYVFPHRCNTSVVCYPWWSAVTSLIPSFVK